MYLAKFKFQKYTANKILVYIYPIWYLEYTSTKKKISFFLKSEI